MGVGISFLRVRVLTLSVIVGALCIVLVGLGMQAHVFAANTANIRILKSIQGTTTSLRSNFIGDTSDVTWLLYRIEDPQKAIALLRETIRRRPYHVIARLRLGEILSAQGQEDQALTEWSGVHSSDIYFARLGARAAETGNLVEGQRYADIVQKLAPFPKTEHWIMYDALGRAFRKNGDIRQALPWYALAARARNDGWAQISLAVAQLDTGDYEGTLSSLRWALEVGKTETRGPVFSQMAQVYLRTGDWEKAVDAFRIALDLGTSNKWLYMGLAQALLRSGNLSEACSSFEKALQMGYAATAADRGRFSACRSDGGT